MDKIYLIRGNDTPLAVCLRKSEGEGDPVPYDLSTAERMRLALVGHGMHVFAVDIAISGEDDNIVSGVIPGRSLLKGDYNLEVTFNLDGRDKRFAVKDMFEAVDFLAEDADGEAEGEGAGIFVTVTVQPELIEISGPTGPRGKSAYQVWLDDGHTGTEDDFFEWLAAQTPNPDWEQNDPSKADYIKGRTHYEETSTTTINNASLAWSGSTPEDLDFWLYGSDVHIPRTSAGWELTWQGGKLFIDDNGFGYELGVYNGEEWSINPFDPSYDQQPYPLNVDVVIASETVHKLDNKFLDMDTEPTTGSGKPVTSGGVKAAIADFVTRAVNDLLNYYTKTETYTKAEVNQLVAGINNWEIVPVAQLPEASADTMHKIYLVPSSNPKTRNVKDEFITVEVSGAYSWEQIGTTAIDLTNYVTKQELTAALADYVTSSAFTQALATKQDAIEDLSEIRQGASLGATAYQKPADGIPADDLKEGVIPDTSKLAEKDGYYPEMSVGSLKGTEVTQVEGITTIAKSTGLAKINEVMGRSLVWNQRVSGYSQQGSTTVTGDYTSLQFTANARYGGVRFHIYPGVEPYLCNTVYQSGHKYALSVMVKTSSSLIKLGITNNTGYAQTADSTSYASGSGNWERITLLPTTNTSLSYFAFVVLDTRESDWDAVEVKNPMVIDLTQLFQSGNEPSTVVEFESWLANNIGYRDYYAYNAGKIISNNTEALEITGLNQWDEEWEVGAYYNATNGNKSSAAANSTNLNPVKLLPNTNYFFHTNKADSGSIFVVFFDSSNQYCGYVNVGTSGKQFTPPTNAAYCHFNVTSTFSSTGGKVCISVSGSRDGQYEPYQKSELELNLATITGKLNGEGESVTIFPDGGPKSADTAFDSFIVDEDGWCRRAFKRLDDVSIGSLSWIHNTDNAFYVQLPKKKRGMAKLLTKVFDVSSANFVLNNYDSYPDKTIFNNVSNLYVYVKYTAYTTVADFKAALGDDEIIYELDTPREYVLDTPIYMGIKTEQGGVIRQLPENGSAPTTAPMRMSVTYALPAEALMSEGSIRNMLEALKAAGKINTYTMAWDYTIGKWTFSFT